MRIPLALSPMRLAITGAAGMLGQDLVAAARGAGHEALAFPRAELDIADRAAVAAAFGEIQPDVVVNCAAWTDVDGAERDEAGALAVNAAGAGNVARAAGECGAWTIHVSSDYVFDGFKRTPYLESDPVGPLSAYGRSKLEGERAVIAGGAGEAHDRPFLMAVRCPRWLLSGHDRAVGGRTRRAQGGR